MASDDNFGERNPLGRWKKGVSGNPQGRPKKPRPLSEDDIAIFGKTSVTLNINGSPRKMSRELAVRYKLYERAMNGHMPAIRELQRLWNDRELYMALARERLDHLEEKYLGEPLDNLRRDQQLEILELRKTVSYGRSMYPFGVLPKEWKKHVKAVRKEGEERKRLLKEEQENRRITKTVST